MSEIEFPEGWAKTTVGDLVRPIQKTEPRKWEYERPFTYFDIGAIDNASHQVASPTVLSSAEAASRARQVVQPGDVLFSTVRTYLENVAVVPEAFSGDLVASTGFCVLRAAEGVDPAFLFHLVLSPAVLSSLAAHQQGTSYPAIRDKDLLSLEVAIPGTNEQRRISAELERRLSHVDQAIAGLISARVRSKQLRKSILHAAAQGSLVSARADRTFIDACNEAGVTTTEVDDRGWVRVKIGSVAQVGSGATPKKGESRYWVDGTIPWVTSGQVSKGIIGAPTALITQTALAETSVRVWPAGTLLVAMYGEGKTRGTCGELGISAGCNQACAAIALKEQFRDLKGFLKLILQARYEESRSLSSGGVQENLNLGLIKDMYISVPGFSTQQILVAEAERKLSLLDVAERSIESNLTRAQQLRRALLAAAFSGKLVPQDPNDEPAEVLLDKIRAEREEAAAAAKDAKAATKTTKKPAVRKTSVRKKETQS